MKKLLLLSLTFLNSYWIFGQVCGTPHPVNPIIYPDNSNARGASSAYCLDVFFHVVRNTNGTNAFALPNTDDIVEELNEFYSPHDIIINNAGTGFINNTNVVNIDNSGEALTLGQTNNRPDAINYYIVETLWNTDGGFVTGTANSIPSNNLVIREDRVLTSTSSHELGHCLNLLHTFETARGVETINGSNCISAGDLVCDTPADQNLGNANGRTPDLTNIMSYYRPRDHFTNGQGQRIRTALANESILEDITSNSCVRITAVDNVCYPQSKTLSLSNLGGATATWTSSSNAQIVSSNNTSAEIRGLNSSSTGNGWIRATLNNGIILQEDFEVGTPQSSLMTFNRYASYNFQNNRWNLLGVNYNGQLDINKYTWEFQVPNSLVRHSSNQSYINFRPNVNSSTQIYIKARASNECGCSNWSGKWFNVIYRNTDPCRDSNGRPCNDRIIEY